MIERAGQSTRWPASNSHRSSDCARSGSSASDSGSFTCTFLRFAWPGPCVSTARTPGCPLSRSCLRPVSLILSRGRSGSAWQSPTWKCCVAWWMAPVVETIVALICFGPHEVGLSVKPGRFTSTLIDRNLHRHALDDRRQRIGHDRDVRVDRVDEDRLPHDHHAEVERARDHAHRRRQPERRALVRAGQRHRTVDEERIRARTGADRRRADARLDPARAGGRLARRDTAATSFSFPIRPGGISIVSPLMYCWRSGRLMRTANGENAPPVGFDRAGLERRREQAQVRRARRC